MSGKKKPSKRTTRGRNLDQSVQNLDRQLKALELRKAGVNYQQIADTLGYANPSGAFKAVERALKSVQQEPASELLKLELERLDAMLVAIAPAVRAGNFGAIDRALRIAERRARLLGLDAAAKLDVDAKSTHVFTLKIGDRVLPIDQTKHPLQLPQGQQEDHDLAALVLQEDAHEC